MWENSSFCNLCFHACLSDHATFGISSQPSWNNSHKITEQKLKGTCSPILCQQKQMRRCVKVFVMSSSYFVFYDSLLKQLFPSCTVCAAKVAWGKQSLSPFKWAGRLTCWVAVQTALYSLQRHLSPTLGTVESSMNTIYWGITTVHPPDCYSAAIWHTSVCMLSQNKDTELWPKASITSWGLSCQ